MPKFSETEKEIIRQKLYTEGERLFATFGIKKVSIDEIVQAIGIAKGSFYTFYTSKEHLYLDIAGRLQEKMWREMDEFLQEHRHLPPKELTKQCFIWMFSQIENYPMLMQTDNETVEYLYRKLPQEVIDAHTQEDRHELESLEKYGVHFKCDMEVATKTLQVLAISFLNFQNDKTATQNTVMELMLDGVLNEIVGDEND